MQSSSSAASCFTSCPRASSRSATSACSPTAIAVRHSPFAECTSTQTLPDHRDSHSTAATGSSSLLPQLPARNPAHHRPALSLCLGHLHHPGVHRPHRFFLNTYDYAETNSQAQPDQPIAGRSTLVPKIAYPNVLPTSPLSNHPAISILVAVPVPSCCQTAHAISRSLQPHSIPIETRLTANRPIDNAPPTFIAYR